MDSRNYDEEYYEFYAAQPSPRHPQAPTPMAQPSAQPLLSPGPYTPSQQHPQYVAASITPSYEERSARMGYLYPAACPTPNYAQHVHSPAPLDPSDPSLTGASTSSRPMPNLRNPQVTEQSNTNIYPNVQEDFVSTAPRRRSALSQTGGLTSEPYPTSPLAREHKEQLLGDRASMKFTFRRRTGSSRSRPPYLPGGSHPWDHTPGSKVPHPAAPSSSTPLQHDLLIEASKPMSPAGHNDNTLRARMDDPSTSHAPEPPVRLAPMSTMEGMYEYFPLSTPAHETFRVKLLEVMNSLWRRSNKKEPDSQLLLQFASKIEENGQDKHKCLFWCEGTECGKLIPRSDRMLEHLRRHIGVRPFVCDCNSEGCPGIFPSKSAMYQHQKNVEPVQCQRCGAQVLRQNLARHWRAQRCQPIEDS